MTSIKSKDRKSLCEESMLVFVNILKFSSLSIARSVTTSTTQVYARKGSSSSIPQKAVDKGSPNTTKLATLANMQHRSKRSQKPDQLAASKYVMLPDPDPKMAMAESSLTPPSYRIIKDEIRNVDGQFSDYIRRFHEKTENDHQNAIVEGKAEKFIKRFHQKNMSDLNNESMRRNYVLPPPPPTQLLFK